MRAPRGSARSVVEPFSQAGQIGGRGGRHVVVPLRFGQRAIPSLAKTKHPYALREGARDSRPLGIEGGKLRRLLPCAAGHQRFPLGT